MEPLILKQIPPGFLTVDVTELKQIIPKPCLIFLSGKRAPALFVSTLLHGNETTGFYALQRLLANYSSAGKQLPRSMIIFLGNVEAAAYAQRFLPGQVDYNRIWAGGETLEHRLARHVLAVLSQQALFACIDIHNNTGANPHYGCVSETSKQSLYLASLFSSAIVYFTEPHEVQTRALVQFAPAVTLEAGKSGNDAGVRHVLDYLETCLALETLQPRAANLERVAIFHTMVRVLVPPDVSFTFAATKQPVDITFLEDIDYLNFTRLSVGSVIGRYQDPEKKLKVLDSGSDNIVDDYFAYIDGEIRLKREVIPAMFTKVTDIVRKDCLGYLMEEYKLLKI